MGAPKDFSSKLQTGTGASHIKSFIRYLKNFEFERPLGEHAPNQRILYEPKGVCALITPWNWPMNQVCLKVIPAIAAGCTMVLKPSELAPLSSIILAEIIDEAKFPPGVFNLVNGDGAVTGDALTSHPDVNMISFTGSTRAGSLISKNAAQDFKRVSLELGGKGANIIFKDADPEAVERGALRCFRNSGQSCNAPTRMLIEKSMYNEAVERLTKYANEFKVDDPNKEGDHIGPVISETQFNKIQNLIKKGIDEGAKLVAGGPGKPDGLDKGYYVKPTVFADVKNNMEIAKTEIFGPVLSVMSFESEEEAISIANDTPYGLTNYIQTQDPEKVKRVARKLRSCLELVEFIRSTPLLIQLFFVYFVLPQFGIKLSAWLCGMITIGLHFGTYLSEVYRGALEGVNANEKGFVSFHQDAKYIGLEPHNWVTAWIAVTNSNEENGCMRMWSGSHKGELKNHVQKFDEDNLLTRGQTIVNVSIEEINR